MIASVSLLACLAVAACAVFVGSVIWVACGESDALNSAERDAGMTDDEIERATNANPNPHTNHPHGR